MPRVITLMAVALVHLGFIALLMMASSSRTVFGTSHSTLELVYIPTRLLPPRVRADTGRPERLRARLELPPLSPATPVLTAAPRATTSSGSGSRGLGVDWSAEAHRAVLAYEIRRDNPAQSTLAGKSPANDWWPQQGPHAGDRFKTDGGDWIVWINSDCYQIARWHASEPSAEDAAPQIVCPEKSGEPQR